MSGRNLDSGSSLFAQACMSQLIWLLRYCKFLSFLAFFFFFFFFVFLLFYFFFTFFFFNPLFYAEQFLRADKRLISSVLFAFFSKYERIIPYRGQFLWNIQSFFFGKLIVCIFSQQFSDFVSFQTTELYFRQVLYRKEKKSISLTMQSMQKDQLCCQIRHSSDTAHVKSMCIRLREGGCAGTRHKLHISHILPILENFRKLILCPVTCISYNTVHIIAYVKFHLHSMSKIT